ncbi:hypothetical protein BDQ17DRAFT_1376034 [Cyathus striatus]|nr:hypothetical protein BDQ17DRAFT_1376034 [Cyathus striatus]
MHSSLCSFYERMPLHCFHLSLIVILAFTASVRRACSVHSPPCFLPPSFLFILSAYSAYLTV